MPARPSAPSRDRDYDFSNVGKVGRRTGVTLAPREVDEHGLENMSGMFSSPRKQSPEKTLNGRTIVESVEEGEEEHESATSVQTTTPRNPQTPATSNGNRVSTRRSNRGSSHPIPRSASPRKSGITGSARRIGVHDVMAQQQLQLEMDEAQEQIEEEQQENTVLSKTQLTSTPVQILNARAASARPATVRRFSPDRTPLRNRVLNRGAKSAMVPKVSDVQPVSPDIQESIEDEDPHMDTPSYVQTALSLTNGVQDSAEHSEEEDDVFNAMGADEKEDSINADHSNLEEIDEEPDPELPQPPPLIDNSDEDTTFDPSIKANGRRGHANKANSRRKRKSDAMAELDAVSSPTAKRAKRRSDQGLPSTRQTAVPKNPSKAPSKEPTNRTANRIRGREPLASKPTNTKLSDKQQQELEDVVDKIRARPGQKKSLYILRRETPADDGVTHTRSGRVSIKPLAYWRNEGIVYGGSPGGIADGQRFPLNSIKEIVRTEEKLQTPHARRNNKNNGRKGKGRAGQGANGSNPDPGGDDGDAGDSDAQDWELENGTLKALVSIWDQDAQAPVVEEEQVDIAHASAAIETKQPHNSTFGYAKILSTPFFGAGLVEVPPGGIKKPKNSRKMHMAFFVVQGRVTVEVGPMNAEAARFSIGKGGFWQVPRGNNYSIENEHGKTARIFFSQACEPAPVHYDE